MFDKLKNDHSEKKPIYLSLQSGDKLENGDEYSTDGSMWRTIPAFLIGDKIPQVTSETKWRRILSKTKEK
jgi:hypothetical protein